MLFKVCTIKKEIGHLSRSVLQVTIHFDLTESFDAWKT